MAAPWLALLTRYCTISPTSPTSSRECCKSPIRLGSNISQLSPPATSSWSTPPGGMLGLSSWSLPIVSTTPREAISQHAVTAHHVANRLQMVVMRRQLIPQKHLDASSIFSPYGEHFPSTHQVANPSAYTTISNIPNPPIHDKNLEDLGRSRRTPTQTPRPSHRSPSRERKALPQIKAGKLKPSVSQQHIPVGLAGGVLE